MSRLLQVVASRSLSVHTQLAGAAESVYDRLFLHMPLQLAPLVAIASQGTCGSQRVDTTSLAVSYSDSWHSGVLAPNGKIYGIPAGAPVVLIIDPAASPSQSTATRTPDEGWRRSPRGSLPRRFGEGG